MSRICLIKGQSQYDTTRTFIDQLEAAFRSLGHVVHLVDMVRQDWPSMMANAFSEPVAFVFSFNAAGIDVATEGVSVYDRVGTTFIAGLMDHPIYHLERLASPVRRALIGCVDRTHAAFLARHSGGRIASAFLPHGGIEAAGPKTPVGNRDFDVVFSGTYTDPEQVRSTWSQLPEGIGRIFHHTADVCLANDSLTLEAALDQVLERVGLWPTGAARRGLMENAIPVDTYVRAQRRQRTLEALVRGGVRMDVWGDNWDASPIANSPHARLHPGCSYVEMLETMSRAKIVLNVLPAFPDGSHDRVFCGMLNGAVAATDTNRFLAGEFADGRDAVFYSNGNPDALPERLHALLAQPEQMQSIADQGRATCRAKHTWTERARSIATLAETITVLEGLRGEPG